MHISSCEHPKEVINPYTRQYMTVPCGVCPTCLSNKSSKWISRLEAERRFSRFCVFFTLTYSDYYLPKLTVQDIVDPVFGKSSFLVHVKRDFSSLSRPFKHSKLLSDEYNTFKVPVFDSVLAERSTEKIINLHDGYIPYTSVFDIQHFIKRLRSCLQRAVYNTTKGIPEDGQVRYALCSELGPTTLRPHIHGLLYFDNPQYASILSDVLSACWQFGFFCYEFVQSSASSYVAQYVSSFQHLPRIYQLKALRPFFLTSKSTPIGLRSVEETTINDIFHSSSCLLPVYDVETSDFSFVPVWRTLEDRLFPKLPFNSSLSSQVRFRLLSVFTIRCKEDFPTFCRLICDLMCYRDGLCHCEAGLLFDYLDNVCYNQVRVLDRPVYSCFDFKLNSYLSLYDVLYQSPQFKRVYYVARRVSVVCSQFNCSLRYFCDRFDAYFLAKDYYNLSEQLSFEESFSLDSDCRFLLNIDRVRFNYYSHLDYSMMHPEDMLVLQGYGFQISEIIDIHSCQFRRKEFYKLLHFNRTFDFTNMASIRHKIYSDTHKTKKKNEYLLLHPEFKDLY